MDKIIVKGGQTLEGKIKISGAKNASLPLLCCPLLTNDKVTFTNVPELGDIRNINLLLECLGVEVTQLDSAKNAGNLGHAFSFETKEDKHNAPYELVSKMRASILVLGPLLARIGQARVSLPGGCAIGARPVDLHIKSMEALGAEIELDNGYLIAKAPNGLKGNKITFPFPSVGATENAIMAATLAEGETIINNAAQEPEIIDLGNCLVSMGAKIKGIGTSKITINGVKKLHGCEHRVLSDRIETGTYAIAAAITGGEILLENTSYGLLESTFETLKKCNIDIIQTDEGLLVSGRKKLIAQNIITEPQPGFPTDMQAQYMALMLKVNGVATIKEQIFENRFMHVPEFVRMGANISLLGNTAIVTGGVQLKGAKVMATDLRASVSLVLAGLIADGETIVTDVHHLDRGYANLEDRLSSCGAIIKRVKDTCQK